MKKLLVMFFFATVLFSCKKEEVVPEYLVPEVVDTTKVLPPAVDTTWNYITMDTISFPADTSIMDSTIYKGKYTVLQHNVTDSNYYCYNSELRLHWELIITENGWLIPFNNLHYQNKYQDPYGLLVHFYKGTIKLKFNYINGYGAVKNFTCKTIYKSQTEIKMVIFNYDLLDKHYTDYYIPL